MSFHHTIRIAQAMTLQLPSNLPDDIEVHPEVEKMLTAYMEISRHEHAEALRHIAVSEFIEQRTLGFGPLWEHTHLTEYGVRFRPGSEYTVHYPVEVEERTHTPVLDAVGEARMREAVAREAQTEAYHRLVGMNSEFLANWFAAAQPILEGGHDVPNMSGGQQQLVEHYALYGPQSVVQALKAIGITVDNEADVMDSADVCTRIRQGTRLRFTAPEATGEMSIVDDPVGGATEVHIELDHDESRASDRCQQIAETVAAAATVGLSTATLPMFRQTLSRSILLQSQDADTSGGKAPLTSVAPSMAVQQSNRLRN